MLKKSIMEEPILIYPDLKKPYTLFTVASKYAWTCVLIESYKHEIDGVPLPVQHPITYQSGFFRESELN